MSSDAGVDTSTRRVFKGLAWSAVSNVVLRLGTFATGILLARLLSPAEFGTYAVALTVQSILMILSDLGLTAVLIRVEDPAPHRRTVATLSLSIGLVLGTAMATGAPQIATLMGSPAATVTIAVLALTLPLGGAGIVPFSLMQRRFQQKRLFIVSLCDFATSTAITVVLILIGLGPLSLAIGRVAAQAQTTVLQHVLAHEKPSYGFNREVARQTLAFGLPVVGADVFEWVLLNSDNVVVSRVAGSTALGFYVLAFNISGWPMTAIGQVLRSVVLPLLARMKDASRTETFIRAAALAWAVALPVGLTLAVLSSAVIDTLYGSRWAASAVVLAALGCFGAVRVLFDQFAAYLLSRGASRSTMWVQVGWWVVLLPSLILATRYFGIVGAGWVHLAVATLVVFPVYLLVLARHGVSAVRLLSATWQPVAAMVPAAAAGLWISQLSLPPFISVLLGGASVACIYAVLIHRWALRMLRRGGKPQPNADSEVDAPAGATEIAA
jgi:O-antigen/teichoic acid export membrane protein